MNLALLLARAARVHGGSPAVACGARRVDYARLGERVAARAAWLVERGVRPGDRVAFVADNTLEHLEAYFACAWVGAVACSLNGRLAPRDVAGVLADAEPRVLLADVTHGPLARAALAGGAGAVERFGWLGASGDEAPAGVAVEDDPLPADGGAPRAGARPEPVALDEDALAQLYHTSGTTGKPKGVMLTHGNVGRHALAAVAELSVTEADTWGHVAPMFHLADAWACFAVTLAGGCHAFLPRFETVSALDLLEREGVTLTNLVPTMLGRMVAQPGAAARDWSRLRLVLSGGAPIAPETVRRIAATFRCEYVQTYGMTETSPYLTLSKLSRAQRALPEDERLAIAARTGRPFAGVELEVVDAAGRAVPADDATVGEIRVRGATVTPGYWRDPAATEEAIRDGWLRTGDLATVDASGSVRIVDRAKDLIKTGGESVYSTEVEAALYEHAGVLEAAVYGVPDPEWGEVVQAAVVARPGAALDAEAVRAHCAERLAAYKVPRRVELLDALPRTGSGKVSKRLLRQRADAR